MPKADLTKRRAFAEAYAQSGNATQAALLAGVPQGSAHSMGYRWLRNSDVVALVRQALDDRLKSLGPPAIQTIHNILLSDQVAPQTRLQAARDVLDRLGWVPPKRGEITSGRAEEQLEHLTREELERIVAREYREEEI